MEVASQPATTNPANTGPSAELPGLWVRYLYLTSRGPTAREGRQSNSDNTQHEFSYSRRDPSKSLIDTPPGAK